MADDRAQQLFDVWKRQLDEGTQAWARLMTQTASSVPPDAPAFWRPLIDHGFQTWARAFAQTPLSPDIMTQWKQLMDQAMEAWSRALGQVMGTEAFAQALGRTLDQFLVASAPAKKAADQSIEVGLQSLNLPSRAQVTGVAKQIVELEERIEVIEDGLGAIMRRLDDISRALGGQAERPGATREPR